MIRRHALVSLTAVVLAASGIAIAEPDTKPAQPTTAPAKKEEPKKEAPKADPSKKDEGKEKKPAEKAARTLKVGDKAPAMKVEKWLKGTEVKGFDAGKVYVVEFWATWCGPCKMSIPHLTQMQKAHKAEGLTVIGVTTWEKKPRGGAADTREKTAQDFVNKQGDQMDYTVAYDGSGQMDALWLKPAGVTGIPTAFVVDHTGTVTYIGHPADEGFETAITKALAAAKGGKADAGAKISPVLAGR